MVINYMEEIVRNYLNDLFKTNTSYTNVCRCEQCVEDILAKALNNIKPYYITTKKGEVFAAYSSLETQHQAEVISEVIKAMEFVSAHPNH